MVDARISSNGGSMRIKVDPEPRQVAKDISRLVSKPMAKKVGDLHKKLGDIPIKEIERRATRAGSGRRRIGRAVKPSATRSELVITGGRGFPDFAGQEWGSKRWPQFLPYNPDGHVIGAMMSDAGFMQDMLEKYADGLGELIEEVFNE
jgi:hypothetical protein